MTRPAAWRVPLSKPSLVRKFELLGPFDVAVGDLHEGLDHSDDGSEEPDHGGNSANVGEVADPLGQDSGLTVSLGFGYFANFGLAGVGVLSEKIEGFLGDASDEFVAAVAESDEAKIIAFANHGLGGIHELICDHSAATQGQEVEKNKD